MRNIFAAQNCLFLAVLLLAVLDSCVPFTEFSCPKADGSDLPTLPDVFSTNIRLNYARQLKTIDMRYVVNSGENKLALEIWDDKRHVKYIQQKKEFLIIKYDSDEAPKCSVMKTPTSFDFLEEEDAGPENMLEDIGKIVFGEKIQNIALADVGVENGVYVRRWEGCFKSPAINVSLAFSDNSWKNSQTSTLHKGMYIVSIDAQTKKNYLTALFSNFDPKMPDDSEFQPPANVFCKGFRSDRKIPKVPNFFSYDSELIVFKDSTGIASVTVHRSVYYDYPAGIVRSDFYDAIASDSDLFSELTAQSETIIHDFNSGIQYNIDPVTGGCMVDDFKVTVGPASVKLTDDKTIPDGLNFFRLNAKTSFNGEFPMRGYMTDVFTALVEEGGQKNIYTWYFAADTQIVEKGNVERDVLLRMDIRPEAGDGDEGSVIVNFYSFDKEEPNVALFDITSCYNQNFSKTFVLTFPAHNSLRGMEKFVKQVLHEAIRTTTKLNKMRIFVTEVIFTDQNMFADVKLLDTPESIKKAYAEKPIDLDTAISSLNQSITSNLFVVSVPVENDRILLKANSDGLNEYATSEDKIIKQFKELEQIKELEREKEREKEKEKEKEREKERKQESGNYPEGSVIGLTVGMLLLGFLLGAVTLNLIVSRKYGVALFLKKQPHRDPFSDSGRESSI